MTHPNAAQAQRRALVGGSGEPAPHPIRNQDQPAHEYGGMHKPLERGPRTPGA